MTDPVGPSRDLVFLGGGHAHALALRMLAMQDLGDVRISLVSLDAHTPYSGMLPGLVAGHYDFFETHIDLQQLCARAGVRFITARATGLDSDNNRLFLEGRPPLAYDLLSIDIGSQPGLHDVPGAEDYATPVKPVHQFYQRWQEVEARLGQAQAGEPDSQASIILVGGGAGSVELALSMRYRLRPRNPGIRLFCGGGLLETYNKRSRNSVRKALGEAGIEVLEQSRVVQVEEEEVHSAGGQRFRYDELFWCTAAEGEDWLAQAGLPVDERGFLKVEDSLQVMGHGNIFAAGDVATQVSDPRPKAGVYAVRQAPVLAHNLAAALRGESLKNYRPQKRFLSLLAMGEQQAVADRGAFWASGKWVWKWKDRIDRKFMQQFRDFAPQMKPPSAPAGEIMQCGGCGAKLPATILRDSLEELAKRYPEVVDRARFGDDAVAVDVPAGKQLLQSVDILRNLVADPWLMGRIAVMHSLSDLYAMGARPLSALANLSVSYGHPRMQQRDLQQLLMGAAEEMKRAGCQWLGGHTLEGPDLSVGFTVNGVLDAGPALTKTGVREGDHLILAKPLGTGVLFAAEQQGQAEGHWIRAAIAMMLQSNAAAAQIARQFSASAVTDVTGFGLAGHLGEMLPGSELQARLSLPALPLLPGAEECWQAGIESSLQDGNRLGVAHLTAAETETDGSDPRLQALYDPQTSGGLLFTVAAQQAAAVVSALHEAGFADAANIGTLCTPDPGGAAIVVQSEEDES
jgi:selenide,water dikinase